MRKGIHAVAVFGIVAGLTASSAGAADGKAVFVAQKCDTCHSVSTAGIAATTKSEKMKGPDLVGVVQAHDRAFVADIVHKKINGPNGKKHVKEWKGTEEELQALIDFLEAQKKS
jgi:cytochrome c5